MIWVRIKIIALGIGILLTTTADGVKPRPSSRSDYLAQQQNQEQYRRLYATVEELQDTIVLLQQQIAKLKSELTSARKQITDLEIKLVTKKQLESLNEQFTQQLKQMDQTRVKENGKIVEQIKLLAQRPEEVVPPLEPEPEPAAPSPEPSGYTGPVFEIEIQKGYTIRAIAQKYSESGHKITAADILKANPGVDPRKLKIGQIIKIPAAK